MIVLKHILAVGFGGFLGSVLRYCVSVWLAGGIFPLKTLLVNVAGSFVIGLAAGAGTGGTLYYFVATGICGGFTTFSAFSLEVVGLVNEGNYFAAFAYAISSLVLSFGAAFSGMWISRQIL